MLDPSFAPTYGRRDVEVELVERQRLDEVGV
jgi:hypothetical protein